MEIIEMKEKMIELLHKYGEGIEAVLKPRRINDGIRRNTNKSF